MRRLLLLLPLLISGVIAAEGEEPCRRQFFAQPVVYDRAMDIDFYYTGINMESVAACAEFCGGRHFCRTAVYNTQTKTCAISYEYTLSCRYTTQRYEKFEHKGLKSHLIQVACVSKCNSTDPNTSLEPATGEPERRVSKLRRVGIVTGPPIDGPSFRAEQSGFLNSVTIDNITNVLPANDPVKRKRKGQVCFRLLKRKYLLGAMFERHEGVTINQCRCLCAATYVMDSKYMCESLQWFQSGTCILNKASHRGKYDLIDDSQAVYQYVDCDVPVLLDMAGRLCMNDMASTTTTTTTTEATTTTTEKPTTTTTSTTSVPIPEEVEASFPNAPPETTTAGTSFVTGQPEGTKPNHEEPETTSTTEGSSFVTGKPEEPEVSTESTTESTSEPSKELTSVEQTEPSTSSAFVTAPNSAEETTSSAFVTESPSTTAAEEKTESSTFSTTAEVTETSAVVTEAASESTTEMAPKETTVLTNSIEVEEKLPIEKGRCFERIPGHVMRSVAAALEHDVSIDECQCFCAASRLTGRRFDCASATYYPEERDCVLNIEDRHQKPQFFEAQEGQFTVTYLGITCDKESAIALYSPSIRHGSCRVAEPTVAPPTKNRGAHSDACFVELPSFVLEGTAQHVETDVTPEECKCLCAQAEQLFGEACQSFQYYYDGKTCLLNKQNRFSNAEYFNFVPSTQPRSYFEATCVGKAEKLRKYLSKSCPGASMATTASSGVSPVHDEPHKPEAAVETVTSTELMSTTTEQSTTITTTEQPTTTSAAVKTTKRKPRRRKISINRAIPEAEGLDENGFELELSAELSEELEQDSFDDEFVPTKPLHPVINNNVNHDHNPERHKVRGVKTKKFTDKEDKGHVLIEPTTSPATTSPTSTTAAPSTTTTKKPSTTTKTTTTTTTTPGITYPPAGRCTYSALYQTAFLGRRLLKTIFVKTATDCFAACFALRCRSANLVAQGTLQQCELFRDSLIDYRRPDMIGFDAATVYFDGIRCDGL